MSQPASPQRSREAFERAVEALAHKERTVAEVCAWLGERGFGADDVEAAVGQLVETGALDDERFADRFAADKRELRGWGPERIREALVGRGVDAAAIDAAVGAEDRDAELERAIALLAGRAEAIADERSRARALAFLARRGYDSELAYDAVRAAEARATGRAA